jgi:MFS family permease
MSGLHETPRGDVRSPGWIAWMLPAGTGPDAARIVSARALRGFADGCVSVLLASYLAAIGYSPLQISAIVTGTLLGSAALTLSAGLSGHRLRRRTLLLAACALMAATGLGFLSVTAFLPLLAIAVLGTLNPSSGDVSVFLPTEQAMLPQTVSPRERTALFARYNLGGHVAGALGALAAGLPVALAQRHDWDLAAAQRSGFALYIVAALLMAAIYAALSPAVELAHMGQRPAPLVHSRAVVLRLAALFSLDSFGGGFVVQSMLALWLFRRFDISVQAAGAVFFAAGLLAAFSQLVAARLARRIGLINTMVFTHLPSNVLLVLAAVMPSALPAVICLLLRMTLSQLDVPARQSYVMAVVPAEERAAAAGVTNVPRSLASALSPVIAGALLSVSSFGWPLICGGVAKSVYDLLLLAQFRGVKPPEESESAG